MIIFPDTHFFLHYKHPQEIAWSEVTQDDLIHLIVLRTVQKEIEKHKFELRGRPQDRARDYATRLAQIAMDEKPQVLREKRPHVSLNLCVSHPDGWSMPAGLNQSWSDDAFVADVLAFLHASPDAIIAVLTSDPGLIVRAKSFHVPVINLAGRGWEQPAEKSTAEKELEKLRRENIELKRFGPDIVCACFDAESEIDRV